MLTRVAARRSVSLAYIASAKPATVREMIKEIKALFFPDHPTGFMRVKMNIALRIRTLSPVRLVLEDSSKRIFMLFVVVSLQLGSIIQSNLIISPTLHEKRVTGPTTGHLRRARLGRITFWKSHALIRQEKTMIRGATGWKMEKHLAMKKIITLARYLSLCHSVTLSPKGQ